MPMRLITLLVPDNFIEKLNELVQESKYPNRSEAIREAVRDFLKSEGKIRCE